MASSNSGVDAKSVYLNIVIFPLVYFQLQLSQISGSGKDGRVLKEDILNYIENPPSSTPAPQKVPGNFTERTIEASYRGAFL